MGCTCNLALWRKREGVGRCGFGHDRVARERTSYRCASHAALSVPLEHVPREGGLVLPNPLWILRNVFVVLLIGNTSCPRQGWKPNGQNRIAGLVHESPARLLLAIVPGAPNNEERIIFMDKLQIIRKKRRLLEKHI